MTYAPPSSGLVEAVRNAGVVGAGGAGFPTHRKIDVRADIGIANGRRGESSPSRERTALPDAAVKAGADYIRDKGLMVNKVVIPQPRPEILQDRI